MAKSSRLARCEFLAVFCILTCLASAAEPDVDKLDQPAYPEIHLPYFDMKQMAQPAANLVQASAYMRVTHARQQYSVTGAGLTAVVIDTGLRATHQDFSGRVPTQRNFAGDGAATDATDTNGHGTHVAGIICANSVNVGFAPGASVIPLRVFRNDTGSGDFSMIAAALDWVIANAATYNIAVVNMSISDARNHTSESTPNDSAGIRSRIQQLRSMRIPVVVSAGNNFIGPTWNSQEGMGYPAVYRETISVGAIYDANIGSQSGGGMVAYTTAAGRITMFSQRLHPSTNAAARTDVFATGAALTSSGIGSDFGTSEMSGTSQAAPCTAGVILLAQQYYKRVKGQLPTVDDLERWLRASPYTNLDGDDEDDNVVNTQKVYIQADALHLLQTIAAEIGTTVQPPVINSPSVANGKVGQYFQYQITATNNPQSYATSSVPPGLALNGATGLISGTPTTAGAYGFWIEATNSAGTGSAWIQLNLESATPVEAPVITSPGYATGLQGSYFQYQITATNSPTQFTAAGLPDGLTLSTSTGLISGYPTGSGDTQVTLSASNTLVGPPANLTIHIAPFAQQPQITSPLSAYATRNQDFVYTLSASNNPTSVGATALPPGLTFQGYTDQGVIYGQPTATGTFYVTVWASNSAGTVYETLVITVSSEPCGCALGCIADAGQRFIQGLIPRAANWPVPMQGLLSSVRRFRDNVLNQSPEGRALVAAYYAHGCELALHAIDDPALVGEILSFVEELRPALIEADHTGVAQISADQWRRGWALIDRFHEAASPALRNDLDRLKSFLRERQTNDVDLVSLQLKSIDAVTVGHATTDQSPWSRASMVAAIGVGTGLVLFLSLIRRRRGLPKMAVR